MAIAFGSSASLSGLFSARPAADASQVGRFYFATDTNDLYRDSGTAWVLIGTARTYAVYTAILSLTIEDGFQATVLENTLGGSVVWSSSGDGTYIGTLTNDLTFGKTIVTPVLFSSATDDPIVTLVTATKPQDNSTVQVFSTENGVQVPLGYYVPIEIRVYP